MHLVYFSNNNFGDELSQYIFEGLLPDFFNTDESTLFYGIGSILGEKTFLQNAKRIIFSSGFGNYNGPPPVINKDCDVICVRGPITAKMLNIDPSYGITDGAALLKSFTYPKVDKQYDYSYIPHWFSEAKYPWKNLCSEAGIHYISPTNSIDEVLTEIRRSKVVIAEAMHGAIVADIFRVPWIPAKTFKDKYNIKWNDWTQSLEMEYLPNKLYSLVENNDLVLSKIKSKVKLPSPHVQFGVKLYQKLQDAMLTSNNIRRLKELKKAPSYLSKDEVINKKHDQLKEKIELLKSKYSN